MDDNLKISDNDNYIRVEIIPQGQQCIMNRGNENQKKECRCIREYRGSGRLFNIIECVENSKKLPTIFRKGLGMAEETSTPRMLRPSLLFSFYELVLSEKRITHSSGLCELVQELFYPDLKPR
ncbi:hypothetical protein LOAG_09977 [Loa loa]|uniref:Uncharacterized protein n=1 Tax=Loa loa TaxID=7209 RepID=A0A1S0TQU1_LOALO|nr:hypothetical protein LOAG_09977 [Loa loa]EFO18520.1 hypothetical protein LOAG_09977 [Loa loa]